MLPPDPRAPPNNRPDATTDGGDTGADGAKGMARGRDDVDNRDATTTTTVAATALLATDDTEMFACMFDTAVGMAAEMAAQQMGIEGGEEDEGGEGAEEEGVRDEMEGDDEPALSGNEGGSERREGASGHDAEDHSDT